MILPASRATGLTRVDGVCADLILFYNTKTYFIMRILLARCAMALRRSDGAGVWGVGAGGAAGGGDQRGGDQPAKHPVRESG